MANGTAETPGQLTPNRDPTQAELAEALDMTLDQLAYTRRVAQETISLTGRGWTWSNKGAINEMRRDRRVRVHWDAPG